MPPSPLPFDATLIVPGSRICVAVSGGADSVALLCALSEASKAMHPLGVGISVVHVNHGLRGAESDADEAFVQSLCTRLEVPLRVRRVDVPAYRDATGETVEEAARTLRYQVFHSILKNDVDDLLTAHTLDDQAETVLMKLLRGAWTEGLSGIHPVLRPAQAPGKRILRPLLGTSRTQILAYLHGIGQSWREDASNADTAHTRNRLRHHVLPLLRAENPSITQTLANMAELAREEESRWHHELTRILPQLLLPGSPVRGGGRSVTAAAKSITVSLEIDRLRSFDTATCRRILRAAARSLVPLLSGPLCVRLSFDETNRLLALCGFRPDPTISSRPGATVALGRGLTAKRSARELILALDTPIPAKIRLEQ